MLNELKITKPAIAGILFFLVLLVSVRIFQEQLFYDPFLEFYKGENYEGKALPIYNNLKLFISLFFRYALNMCFSLIIIWLFFKEKGMLKLSAVLYLVFFIILATALFIVLNFKDPNLLVVFYIRRFLIQPLLLILFIPAFYYQRKMKGNL